MARTIPIPESILHLFIFVQFRKRISATEAERNMREAMRNITDEHIKKSVALDIDVFHLSPDGQAGRRLNVRRRAKHPPRAHLLLDSDSSDIDEPLEIDDNVEYSLNTIRRLYTFFAESEISKLDGSQALSFENIFRILEIRSIAYEPCSMDLEIPIDLLVVTIEFRRITFLIRHMYRKTYQKITYSSWEEGCCVLYESELRQFKGVKYQSLAAKDFFYLVQGPNIKFEKLIFFMDDYHSSHYHQMWPFTNFFWKIEKYLNYLDHRIKVEKFLIKFFERPDHRTSNQSIVMTILPFIEPNQLIMLKFQVWKNWKNSVVVKMDTVSETEQWKRCPHLEISDKRIRITQYDQLVDFKAVWITLPKNHFADLCLAINSHRPPGSTLRWVAPFKITFVVQMDFDERGALKVERGLRLPPRLSIRHYNDQTKRRITFQTGRSIFA